MAKKTKDEQQQVAAEVSSNESKKVGGEAAESKVEATENTKYQLNGFHKVLKKISGRLPKRGNQPDY